MRRPHTGAPPLGRSVSPEEEPRPARHVSTAAAGSQLELRFRVPVCLLGELARPSSFPSSAFSKGAESVCLLPCSRFNRSCPDRGEGSRARLRSGVRSGTLCRLEHFCSMELSAATEMFRARTFQHSKPLTTGSSRGLEMCNEDCNFNLVLHG